MSDSPAVDRRPRFCIAGAAAAAALRVASEIAQLIRAGAEADQRVVLGFATGASPRGVYAELVRMHRDEGLDFAGVHSFNLDEYCGVAASSPRSFASAMQRDLFSQVNIPVQQIHFLECAADEAQRSAACADYEAAIANLGGIDLQLLGIGANGHIAFNEPGAARDSRTREVELSEVTRTRAQAAFAPEAVPTHALTMGIATILGARRIRLLARGDSKRSAVLRALREPISSQIPASFLRLHEDVEFHLDAAIAAGFDEV